MTTKTNRARMGLCLSLGLLASIAAIPLAHAADKRLGVLTFRGPGEGVTRNVVANEGKNNHFQIVGGQQIAKTAAKLGVTLDTNDSFRAIAKDLGIAAFVTGEVTVKKATLTVRNGSDGSVSAEASWSGPNPKKLAAMVQKTFWRRLGSAIERAKPPSGSKQAAVAEEAPAPEPAADSAASDDSESAGKGKAAGKKRAAEAEEESAASPPPEPERKRKKLAKKKSRDEDESGEETTVSAKAEPEEEEESDERLEALDVAVGGRALSRSLSYVQDYNPNAPFATENRRYSLPVAPEVGFSADFYPGALFTTGFAANLGLTANVAYLLPVVATASGNGLGNYATYSLDWSVGAKVRLPLGLFVDAAYGDQRYQLTPTGGAMLVSVPMTEYKYLRGGAGIRYRATPSLAVMANAGYLHCSNVGQIGQAGYFPKATAAAFEAGVAGGYRITPMFEARLGVDIRRYGLAFHVTPADLAANPGIRVAGGAVDQYFTVWAAVAVLMGGESGGGGGGKARHGDDEESESAAAKPAKEKEDEPAADADEADSPPVKKSRRKKQKSDEDE